MLSLSLADLGVRLRPKAPLADELAFTSLTHELRMDVPGHVRAAAASLELLAEGDRPWTPRAPRESWSDVGDRVLEVLSARCSPADAYLLAVPHLYAVLERIEGPRHPAVAEVAGNSEASGAPGSSEASTPPTDGPATPSAGSS